MSKLSTNNIEPQLTEQPGLVHPEAYDGIFDIKEQIARAIELKNASDGNLFLAIGTTNIKDCPGDDSPTRFPEHTVFCNFSGNWLDPKGSPHFFINVCNLDHLKQIPDALFTEVAFDKATIHQIASEFSLDHVKEIYRTLDPSMGFGFFKIPLNLTNLIALDQVEEIKLSAGFPPTIIANDSNMSSEQLDKYKKFLVVPEMEKMLAEIGIEGSISYSDKGYFYNDAESVGQYFTIYKPHPFNMPGAQHVLPLGESSVNDDYQESDF